MSQRLFDMMDHLKYEIKMEVEVLSDENLDLKIAIEQLSKDKKRLTKQVDHLTEMLLSYEKHFSGKTSCNPLTKFLKTFTKA